MDNISKEVEQILELYKQGMRPFKIAAILHHSVSVEVITSVINTYKKEHYLQRTINGITYKEIIDLYGTEEKEILEIMYQYPELTFGQIKEVIEQFYHMQSIKKPRHISFPDHLVKEYLNDHSIEDTCIEFGYSKNELLKKLFDLPQIKKGTKEELFENKMKILMEDIRKVEDKKCSKNQFKKKYKGLTYKNASSLMKQYNIKNNS